MIRGDRMKNGIGQGFGQGCGCFIFIIVLFFILAIIGSM